MEAPPAPRAPSSANVNLLLVWRKAFVSGEVIEKFNWSLVGDVFPEFKLFNENFEASSRRVKVSSLCRRPRLLGLISSDASKNKFMLGSSSMPFENALPRSSLLILETEATRLLRTPTIDGSSGSFSSCCSSSLTDSRYLGSQYVHSRFSTCCEIFLQWSIVELLSLQ